MDDDIDVEPVSAGAHREACDCDGCLFGGACTAQKFVELCEQMELELTPKGQALLAIGDVLDAAATDPDLWCIIRPGRELFERLCAAEGALLGTPLEDVIAARSAQRPEGPRRYMTYQEWSRVRAVEIESEGAVGSHWPGKASER